MKLSSLLLASLVESGRDWSLLDKYKLMRNSDFTTGGLLQPRVSFFILSSEGISDGLDKPVFLEIRIIFVKSGNSPLLSFNYFSLKNDNLGLKLKILKFLWIQPKYEMTDVLILNLITPFVWIVLNFLYDLDGVRWVLIIFGKFGACSCSREFGKK